jgi:D-alanyl-D-alanine carboxypeptidase/D-alanyl-D-alanine-endopeptidase (penicillin-binding protein 4)
MLCSHAPGRRRLWAPGLIALLALCGAPIAGSAQAADSLPADVKAALQRARVPPEALAVVVQELPGGRTVLAHNDRVAVNPASLVKLLTTYAALEQLGPAWTWSTPVWLQGPVQSGVLDGSLFIQGSGDPKLVVERVWLLLRRVQQLGVREIGGDIVLDNGAFIDDRSTAADFDGDALRPYNVRPSALLLNYKAVTYTFVPDAARGVAAVVTEPTLAGTVVDRSVPLASGPCDDWAGRLKAAFEPGRTRFGGVFPVACGEQSWSVADPAPATYNARLVEALWREMGGRVAGRVRDGSAPAGVAPSFVVSSPPLVEVVREINKFSNNVMAKQLFLTLPLQRAPGVPVSAEAAREHLRRWLVERTGELPADTVIDNGSGLSRETRLSAALLARVLSLAYDSTVMSELMSSLPISGIDGTLRRSRASAGRAHLKTGSLRDVAGRAGYVLSDGGRRYVLVAIVNHPNANAARPALDALVQWVINDTPAR